MKTRSRIPTEVKSGDLGYIPFQLDDEEVAADVVLSEAEKSRIRTKVMVKRAMRMPAERRLAMEMAQELVVLRIVSSEDQDATMRALEKMIVWRWSGVRSRIRVEERRAAAEAKATAGRVPKKEVTPYDEFDVDPEG